MTFAKYLRAMLVVSLFVKTMQDENLLNIFFPFGHKWGQEDPTIIITVLFYVCYCEIQNIVNCKSASFRGRVDSVSIMKESELLLSVVVKDITGSVVTGS